MVVTYRDAGVDIDAGNAAISLIRSSLQSTQGPQVLGRFGGFGGLYQLTDALAGMSKPVLVAGTDGVGTKLCLAIESDNTRSIGQDLVAMCVNDVLVVGAKPLFFLDYYATSGLRRERFGEVVASIATACKDVGCALLGGETAELPGVYRAEDLDLAGFCVGIVDKKCIIDGARVKENDAVLGLWSSGLHANGYSLARRVLRDQMVDVRETLLVPTTLYVTSVLSLLASDIDVRAMAHITGGGLLENIPRSLPDGLGVMLDQSAWTEPPIFDLIRQNGPVEEQEMRRTFNLGIGFVLVVPSSQADRCLALLRHNGQGGANIGHICAGDGVRFAADTKSVRT